MDLKLKSSTDKSMNKKHKCQFCEKPFNFNSQIVKHFVIHNEGRPYECDYCQKAFSHGKVI